MTSRSRGLIGALLIAAAGIGLWLAYQLRIEKPATEFAGKTAPPKLPPVIDAAKARAAEEPAPVLPVEAKAPATMVSEPALTGASEPLAASQAESVTRSKPATPPAPLSVVTAGNGKQPNEVQSTRAMYMAHAPLRTAEVANPDSDANRAILQSMVEKALARKKSDK